MRNSEIENKLKTAVEHSVPDVLGDILSGCGEREGKIIQMTAEGGMRKKKRSWRPMSCAAAVLILVLGSFYGVNWKNSHTVDSIIGIDVNPGVELQINRDERVLQANAVNEDGKNILDGMDLRDTDLNVAVNALIGSMLKNGYIDELANSILITVGSSDEGKGARLQERLAAEINRILSSNAIDGAILSQSMTSDTALKKLAGDYGISEGKAALIQNMVGQNSLWKFEDLAGLSINELNLLVESHAAAMKNIETRGTASDKAYIGEDQAGQIALSHAGVSAGGVSGLLVRFDWEDGRAEYEVEFMNGTTEYEYEIDALTGEIRKYDKETHGGAAEQGLQSSREGDGSSPAEDGSARTDQGNAYIGEAKAKSIALAKAPGASVTSFDFDDDDGRPVYELELRDGRTEHEFKIDAKTGEILKWESETDDDSDHNDDDD